MWLILYQSLLAMAVHLTALFFVSFVFLSLARGFYEEEASLLVLVDEHSNGLVSECTTTNVLFNDVFNFTILLESEVRTLHCVYTNWVFVYLVGL